MLIDYPIGFSMFSKQYILSMHGIDIKKELKELNIIIKENELNRLTMEFEIKMPGWLRS